MNRPAASVVVALMGLPGSGKTTLARALAPRIPARTVSRDSVRAAMFRPCSFTDVEKAAAFEAVLRAVAANCDLGHSTIVDGMPFSRVGEFEALSEASEEHGSRAIPVFCAVSVEEAQGRIRARREASDQLAEEATADDRNEQLVLEVARRFRSLPESTLELDATRPADELAQAVLGHLGEVATRPPVAAPRPAQRS